MRTFSRGFLPFILLASALWAADFKVGEAVEVMWGSTWFKAKVTAVENGKWKIAYDGYGSNWDESVGPDRIRAGGANAPAAASTNATGAAAKTSAFPERPAGKRAGTTVRTGCETS